MWCKFQAFIQRSRSILIITPSVALTVIVGQSLGLFNLPEWKLRDEWIRQRSQNTIADKIVIVTIDEQDIQSVMGGGYGMFLHGVLIPVTPALAAFISSVVDK